jgi:hypothetical protein
MRDGAKEPDLEDGGFEISGELSALMEARPDADTSPCSFEGVLVTPLVEFRWHHNTGVE